MSVTPSLILGCVDVCRSIFQYDFWLSGGGMYLQQAYVWCMVVVVYVASVVVVCINILRPAVIFSRHVFSRPLFRQVTHFSRSGGGGGEALFACAWPLLQVTILGCMYGCVSLHISI